MFLVLVDTLRVYRFSVKSILQKIISDTCKAFGFRKSKAAPDGVCRDV